MQRAAWVPGWYELDPILEVGAFGEYGFWRNVPDELRGPEELVLYNTLMHEDDVVWAAGTIAAIRHPDLGPLRKADTRGLDYKLTLHDGTQLLVNAEESPGELHEQHGSGWKRSARTVREWRFVVEFVSLSAPRPRRHSQR